MENTNRGFKGIWIPKEIWLTGELTLQEKIFLVEIDSLDNDNGCFANNNYFSKFFGISKTRVSIVINSLVAKGFIRSILIYKEDTKEISKRIIRVTGKGFNKNINQGITEGISQEISQGISQGITEAITEGIPEGITKGITDETKRENNKIKEIIDHLNILTNSQFKSMSKNTIKLITARYNEGYETEDFKLVNQYWASKWKDTEFAKYLRPDTLYNGKFENRIAEARTDFKPVAEKPTYCDKCKNGFILDLETGEGRKCNCQN